MNKMDLKRLRNDFQELHYCALDSQCTIYTLTKFFLEHDGNRLLVAPHNGTIMCVGFQNVLPFSKSMSFTYSQAEAEIIAIDSFNHALGHPVIGIIFVKVSRQRRESSGKTLSCYLNIYSEDGVNCDSNLYKIAQTCKTIDLTFLPYQLYHTDLYVNGSEAANEKVFLISGGDEQIHLFVPTGKDSDVNSFTEIDVQNHFVEFSSLPGIVTCMKCLNLPAIGKRLSIVGCKDGKVGVYLVDLFKNELLKSFIYEQDDLITSVQIFTLNPYSSTSPPNIEEFHVLVTSAFEEAFIARGVFKFGFNSLTALKDSNKFDCVTCSLVGDINFDGKMEILIGCYGQKLLIYKLDKTGKQQSHHCDIDNSISERLRINSAIQLQSLIPSNQSSISSALSLPTIVMDSSSNCTESEPHPNDVFNESRFSSTNEDEKMSAYDDRSSVPDEDSKSGRTRNRNIDGSDLQKSFEFILASSRDFHDPVMGVDLADLTSDSVDELVVMTMNGVHILQKNMDFMLDTFSEKLKLKTNRLEVILNRKSSLSENADVISEDDLSEESFITKYE